ncbi:hypothetical protein B566_EDAN012476 [Ephemera danica]|nr:hypothetical protein B566_EDAN012476 [Ephemera danica]
MVEAWSPVLLHHALVAALLLLAASLVFLALGVAVRRWRFVRALASVPGPDAWPVLGNALILMGGQDDFFRLLHECAAKYGECFVLWVGQRPFVFLQSAEAVQEEM